MTYMFRSEITKQALPVGYDSIDKVSRAEVPVFLQKIKEVCKKNEWLRLFVICRIDGDRAWSTESILIKFNQLESDIDALKSVLIRTARD